MGWSKGEAIVERRHAELSRAPQETVRRLQDDLEDESLLPRERARLLALLIAGYKDLEDWDRAESAAVRASSVRRAGRIARTEVHLEIGYLRLRKAVHGLGSWADAEKASRVCLEMIQRLPLSAPKTAWARRQATTRSHLRVSAHVLQGQLALQSGDPASAFLAGLRALENLPPPPKAGPSSARTKKAPATVASLMATALVRIQPEELRAVAPDIEDVAPAIEDVLDTLPSTDRVNRGIVTALLACLLSHAGHYPDADSTFEKALRSLTTARARTAYDQVLALWVWCIRHIQRLPHKADFLATERATMPISHGFAAGRGAGADPEAAPGSTR